jgi:hypothetical protein
MKLTFKLTSKKLECRNDTSRNNKSSISAHSIDIKGKFLVCKGTVRTQIVFKRRNRGTFNGKNGCGSQLAAATVDCDYHQNSEKEKIAFENK